MLIGPGVPEAVRLGRMGIRSTLVITTCLAAMLGGLGCGGANSAAERQMEQFQKLAEQMTASFSRLEERFKMLGDQAEGAARPAPTGASPPHDPDAPPDTR